MDKLDVFYTRFSSEMQRSEGCDDQERRIRAGLAKLGIEISEPLLLRDEAESGTKCDRDAFVELMSLVKAGRVRLLAVDDQARFSRADHAFMLVNDVVYHGGRFISTGEGIDTSQEGWELRVKVMELHNSTTIRELARRVRRGQRGRVLDGNGSAGDFCFGFRAEFADPSQAAYTGRGPKPKKVVVTYEPEAEVVRWIFARFVDGWSIGAIARELTKNKVSKGHRCTKPHWRHQHVRKILGNRKYVGLWPWGETVTVRDSQGRKRQVPANPADVVLAKRLELRIVEEATWQRAQKLLRELHRIYGKKPGQESRAAKVHHTELYPAGLLNGLIHCGACGARMTVAISGKYRYLGCPNHHSGACSMVSRVRVDRAEELMLGFLGGIVRPLPGWMTVAIAAMRHTIEEAEKTVPASLAADEKSLKHIRNGIENLVNALQSGAGESSVIVKRVADLEQQAEVLQERISEQRRLLMQPVTMPDDAWIQQQLADQVSLLAEDTRKAALLLRKLLGKVTAHEVKIRGKKRGYAQLRFRIDAFQTLSAVLESRVPDGVVAAAGAGGAPTESPEFTIDLGSPSRMDQLAPKIVEMRKQGVPWNEIGRITGMSPGNAWTARRRWTEAEDDDSAAA